MTAQVRRVDGIPSSGEPASDMIVAGTMILQTVNQDDRGPRLAFGKPPSLAEDEATGTGELSHAPLDAETPAVVHLPQLLLVHRDAEVLVGPPGGYASPACALDKAGL